MKVAVVGLGYVGAVTSVCLANDGHEVIGIDVDETKLELLRAGKSPIVESGIDEKTAEAVASGRLRTKASLDVEVADCDVVFVCVGTPSAKNGEQDLRALENVAVQIGIAIGRADSYPTIVVRSTVPPGTTDGMFKKSLEEASNKQCGVDFGLCFQPEFLREGSSVTDFYNPPFTVVGSDDSSVDSVAELFSKFPGEFIRTDTRSAELLKVACNTFHALKVTFANEIGRLAKAQGIDARNVMTLLCKDTQLNISPAYLKPGFAFGGSCLPKDLRALLHIANRSDVETPVLSGVLASNRIHVEQAAELVFTNPGRRVGLVGLSFKQGTDDLRESPLVALAELLIGKGYVLKIYDPSVRLSMLLGANLRFIDQVIPHIGGLLCDDLHEVCNSVDTIVVGHLNPEIRDAVLASENPVVDLVGGDSRLTAVAHYSGIAW